jgi:hypothetical protein
VDELLNLHVTKAAQMLQPLDPAEREQLAGALRTLLESFGDTSLE